MLFFRESNVTLLLHYVCVTFVLLFKSGLGLLACLFNIIFLFLANVKAFLHQE